MPGNTRDSQYRRYRTDLDYAVYSAENINMLLGEVKKYVRQQGVRVQIDQIRKNIEESLRERKNIADKEYNPALINELADIYVNNIRKREDEMIERIMGIVHANYVPGGPHNFDEDFLSKTLKDVHKWFSYDARVVEQNALECIWKYMQKETEKNNANITSEQLVANHGEHIPMQGNNAPFQTNSAYARNRRTDRNPIEQQAYNGGISKESAFWTVPQSRPSPNKQPYSQYNPYVQQRQSPQYNPYIEQPAHTQQYTREELQDTRRYETLRADLIRQNSIVANDNASSRVEAYPPPKCTCDEKLSKRIRAGIALAVTIVGMAFAGQFFKENRENDEIPPVPTQPAVTYQMNDNEVVQNPKVTQEVSQRVNPVQVGTSERGINRAEHNLWYEGFSYLYSGIDDDKAAWIANDVESFYRCKRNENETDYEYVRRYAGKMQDCYHKVLRYKEDTPQEHVTDLVEGTEKMAVATYKYEIAGALKEYDPVKYGNLKPNDIEIHTDYANSSYTIIVLGEVVEHRNIRNGQQFAFDSGMAGLAGMRTHAQTMEGWGELTPAAAEQFIGSVERLGESLKCANAANQDLHYSPETGFVFDIDIQVMKNRDEYTQQLNQRQSGRQGSSRTTNTHGKRSSDDRYEI